MRINRYLSACAKEPFFCIKKTVLLLCFGVNFFMSSQVFPQLMIDTAKIKLEIFPQETLTGTINVRNFSERNVDVSVYAQDFVYVPPFDGSKNFLPAGTMDYSCGTWIRFFPEEFTLAPFGKEEVGYSIEVPKGARGGYYGVLFFETSMGHMEAKEVHLKVIQRLGCLFFLETQDKTKRAELKNISIAQITLQGDFVNLGDTILTPKSVFYIMDDQGMIVDRGAIETFYLPPQEETTFRLNLGEELSQKEYTLVLTFDLEEGDSLVKEIDFVKEKTGIIKILQIRD